MRRPCEIENLISPLLSATEYELVGVSVVTGPAQGSRPASMNIRVFIDKADGITGVTIDDIARVSRKIGAFLEVEQCIPGHYTLEVSSPGLDRTLFKPEHFLKQLGQKIHISLSYPQDNQKNFKGILEKVEGNIVYLLVEAQDAREAKELKENQGAKKSKPVSKMAKVAKREQFSFEQIDKARVIPTFKIGATGTHKKRGTEKE